MHSGASPSFHLFLQNLRTSGAYSSQGWHLHIMLGALFALPDVEHRKKGYVNTLTSLKSCLSSVTPEHLPSLKASRSHVYFSF